jgi:methylated-DNA-[protein]-cysteine S-methyltransferase
MNNKKITQFQSLVYEATQKIPKGKVSTYQRIAKAIKRPGSARATGNALNRNPFVPGVPCHRVVKSDGTLGGYAGGEREKANILEKEGIRIKERKLVDFKEIVV